MQQSGENVIYSAKICVPHQHTESVIPFSSIFPAGVVVLAAVRWILSDNVINVWFLHLSKICLTVKHSSTCMKVKMIRAASQRATDAEYK